MQIYLTFLIVTCYLFSIKNMLHNIHGMNNFYWITVFNFFLYFLFFFWTLYKLLFIIFVQNMRLQHKVVLETLENRGSEVSL